MSDLGIYGLEFENVIVIFEISALEFSLLQSLVRKWKSLILGPKMPYLGFCRLTFERKLVIFEATSNFAKRKASCKIKNP